MSSQTEERRFGSEGGKKSCHVFLNPERFQVSPDSDTHLLEAGSTASRGARVRGSIEQVKEFKRWISIFNAMNLAQRELQGFFDAPATPATTAFIRLIAQKRLQGRETERNGSGGFSPPGTGIINEIGQTPHHASRDREKGVRITCGTKLSPSMMRCHLAGRPQLELLDSFTQTLAAAHRHPSQSPSVTTKFVRINKYRYRTSHATSHVTAE
ncbi:hypothetical protein BGY98DRAFT_1175127 [Russula aff. rugulosa BPL654]|nr:hypothetical protein BGY98DRAFT_1175127 [Russula aff. rugulosa BPL654]